jgi:NhaC family Na+:H+ antiporter
MASGVKLIDHIRSMALTTTPTYLITLVVFTYLGLQYADNALPQNTLTELLVGIKSQYTINLFVLLPFITMLLLGLSRIDAIPTMFISIAVALVLALLVQDKSLTGFLNSLYSGEVHHSGVASLDNLLGRGGIASMMWTLSLALIALMLGGILTSFGFLNVLIVGILARVKKSATLVLTTILACFVGNIVMAEAYMSIILGGHLFSDAYDQRGVDRAVLSRSLEDGATLSAALIPWTTAGAFFASTLGVNVLDYAPYAILNWLNPLISIALAYAGVALFKGDRKEIR